MAEQPKVPLAAPRKQLISPPLDATSFEIDGIVYYGAEDIGIKRYKIMQKLDLQFGFDTSFRSICEALDQIKLAIDERKSISDIAYINEGLRRGVSNAGRMELYQLQVLALWYNTADEDLLSYNYEAMVAKMNRWEAGGLSMGFVFAKAAACVRGFREIWLQLAEEQGLTEEEQPESDPSPSPQ